MASAIVMMVAGAVANALAFSGSNYMFHSLEGGSDERKRHDEAEEKLQNATKEWNQKRTNTLDYLNVELQKQKLAENDFTDVDVAMEIYKEYHPDKNIVMSPKPVLSQFYTPGKTQQYGEYAIIASGMTLAGIVVFKFL